ncbi:hypothetical protein [Robiginitalea marina]|uniref:DUF4105 domain-containing protein n=1 Tax=Robiginitalea marina TaxID=2954105 RepID=A0ABT1AW61_9FLAO|nr:hypothetical protein [Robiginitalea marina]MCO5723929.1 hypothetical protein [Robiginitalea marina]
MEKTLTRMLPFALMLMVLPLMAQKKGYLPGYVITLERDTVPGWVKDRSPEPFAALFTRIRFRPEGKTLRRKYRPKDILGYCTGDFVFESFPLREETDFFTFRYALDDTAEAIFLRVVRREGRLTWYEREFIHDDNSYVDSYPLFHREGSREMVRVTQGILGLKKKRLSEYFRECPGLSEALEKKELTTLGQVYTFLLDSCAYRDQTGH